MSEHRRTTLAAATAVLALPLGWGVGSAKTPKQAVDWVKLNPAFKGATFVNNPETCRTCHADSMKAYAETKHAKAFGVSAPGETGECESCHGPRSNHVENPTSELAMDAVRATSAVCLQCHEGGSRFTWKAGPHQSNDVSCSSCHYVMEKRSAQALLIKETTSDTCYQCHSEVRADMNKMSHHPVREGRMDCGSCHNVHGSAPSVLTKNTLNETCYSCHTDKRGPFVWEHAPARESCATCHTSHGSNHRNLLTSKDPFLCLSCHSYGTPTADTSTCRATTA